MKYLILIILSLNIIGCAQIQKMTNADGWDQEKQAQLDYQKEQRRQTEWNALPYEERMVRLQQMIIENQQQQLRIERSNAIMNAIRQRQVVQPVTQPRTQSCYTYGTTVTCY